MLPKQHSAYAPELVDDANHQGRHNSRSMLAKANEEAITDNSSRSSPRKGRDGRLKTYPYTCPIEHLYGYIGPKKRLSDTF